MSTGERIGRRVGVPWLGHTCGSCPYCRSRQQKISAIGRCSRATARRRLRHTRRGRCRLCIRPRSERQANLVVVAPLLCAGLIGWRSLKEGRRRERGFGLYGFGAAAHIIAQILTFGRVVEVYCVHPFRRQRGRITFRALASGPCGQAVGEERPPVAPGCRDHLRSGRAISCRAALTRGV